MIRRLVSQKGAANQTKFRWRSRESSRIEELSDAVFGFALTLLVVSLEVPRTFGELLDSVRGFGAFALCFGLLVVIWFEHYTYFRRYGLQDTYVMVWNSILLFLIVFYVYPLKFLFTLFFNEVFGLSFMVALPGGQVVPMIQQGQLPQLYLIYGLGWTAVWLVFVLLYRYALQQSEQLELSPVEVFDTRASLIENLAAVGVGLLSIALVLLGAAPVAGFVYLVMFPLTWAIRRQNSFRRQTVEARQVQITAGD
jgi:uncharacterized membrane protein